MSYLSIPATGIQQPKEQPTKTYYIDWDKGKCVGRCDGLTAQKQNIIKALITPRFKCLIYDGEYGSELRDTMVYNSASRQYVEATVPRLVKEALLCDSRNTDVTDFSYEFKDDCAFIKCTVQTVFGTIDVEGVI